MMTLFCVAFRTGDDDDGFSKIPLRSRAVGLRGRGEQRARDPRQLGARQVHDPVVRDGLCARRLVDGGRAGARRRAHPRRRVIRYFSLVSLEKGKRPAAVTDEAFGRNRVVLVKKWCCNRTRARWATST